MQTLVIDWTRCDGHGLCHALLPERVELDEWGFPIMHGRGVAPEAIGAARRAVAACPALALSLRAESADGSAPLRATAAVQ